MNKLMRANALGIVEWNVLGNVRKVHEAVGSMARS